MNEKDDIKKQLEVKNKEIGVKGHAGFENMGKDIVCASVSSIIYTSINGIMNIDKSAIKYEDNKKLLKIEILRKSTVVDILLNNMVGLLEELENQYPENIKIIKKGG